MRLKIVSTQLKKNAPCYKGARWICDEDYNKIEDELL